MSQKIIQAYQQAPWRIQVQRLRTFLVIILVFTLVTGMYLSISAQAATTGLNIQDGEYQREVLLRELATLKVQLGDLTSISNMEQRAIKEGYKPVDPEKGMYVLVKGYTGKPPVELAPPPGPNMLPAASLKPEYTQSLWEFLFETVNGLKLSQGESVQ
jgi:hypothetical protein